jgi:hypothetical protein
MGLLEPLLEPHIAPEKYLRDIPVATNRIRAEEARLENTYVVAMLRCPLFTGGRRGWTRDLTAQGTCGKSDRGER